MTRAACNIKDGEGICVPYFSIPNGEHVSDCDNHAYISDICESGWCIKDEPTGSDGRCIAAPVSTATQPNVCTEDDDCAAVGDGITYAAKCECGFNDSATAYCSLFPGDPAGLDYIRAFKYFIAANFLQKCNTARRFNEECWDLNSGSSTWLHFRKTMKYYTDYPKLVNNDKCVSETWTAYYWKMSGEILSAPLILALFFGLIN